MVHCSARRAALCLVVALGTLGIACEKAKSANPLSPNVAGPIPGVDITAPQALEPQAGASITGTGQRTSLVIGNPSTSGVRPVWLQLQLASDAGFQQLVHQADQVTLGANGKTTYTLPEPLSVGHTYYWRVRAVDGANTGPYSGASHFAVVDPVVIETPLPIEPSGTLTTRAPVFKAQNPRVTGPAGTVAIRFEVSRNMSAPEAVVTVSPGADGFATMTMGEMPYDQTVYWRVVATDGETTSAPSQVLTFRTPAAPAPTPAPPPAPTPTPTPGPTPTPTPTPAPTPVGGQRTISPDEALSIIRSVHDAEGWNLGSRSSREQRVEFLNRAVAVVHYGHARFNPKGPDANWCVKDAGGGRPQSDDVIARCDSREAWDLIGSAGADGYRFHLDHIGRLPGGQNVYPPPRSSLPR